LKTAVALFEGNFRGPSKFHLVHGRPPQIATLSAAL
jgi:hypothetical protein